MRSNPALPILRTLAFALAALVPLSACNRGTVAAGSNTTPVVLISIDTLRSDHLPAYGYKGVATPNIDALRADSVLYERVYSHVPLTLPSHTSILTGLLPADHGVRDNVGFRLAENIPTVQELLKKNGYATGAAISAFVLRHETGIARGFDFFDDQVEPMQGQTIIGRVQRDGMQSAQILEGWLSAHSDKPFFAFLHLYEPHTPYTPPEPFFSRYSNHYDGEIAYADQIVGNFIDFLKQKGVYDKAVIILLSDHGEGLSEHGEEEHGIFLYREDLQVPLMIKLPKQRKAGATVKTPAELADVFPTILERTATPPPKTGHRIGESLLTLLNDPKQQRPIYAETFYPRFHFGWSDLHSLIEGNDHYIRAPQAELYDLAADPGEKKNILQENRRATVRLRAAIEPFVTQAAAPTAVDREEQAKLAALGYVGSTVATNAGDVLPDPKTTVGVFHDIRQAFTWYRDGREDEALKLTDKLLADNAQITDLWDLKCKIFNKLGRPRDAINAAKDGLRHAPTSIALLFDVANDALALGDLDDAQQHAEIAVKIEPGEAHEILARIWAKRGDKAKAEQEAKAALETAHDPVTSLMLLATLTKDRGDLNASLDYLNRAAASVEKKDPPKLQNVHLTRGDVLARLGRGDEAEREFRAEIQDFPEAPEAYSSLIMLLATERRTDEATKVVFDMVKASPKPHTYAMVAETLKAIGDDRGAMFWAYQGQQKFPNDAELKALPARLNAATKLLQSRMTN